jgi:CRISPR type IV-associated protein Csf3
MQPFRVQINLKSPMVEPRFPIYLDGLLSGLRVAQDENIHWDLTQHDLPLERLTTASAWCFKASAFNVVRTSDPREWMLTSRINLTRAAEDRQSGLLALRASLPNTAGGPFKTSKFSATIFWAQLEAWGVGDIKQVSALLSSCEQIGSRRSLAFGQVESITVDPVSPEYCHWYRRSLPADTDTSGFGDVFVPSHGNLKAPYWNRATEQSVILPADL